MQVKFGRWLLAAMLVASSLSNLAATPPEPIQVTNQATAVFQFGDLPGAPQASNSNTVLAVVVGEVIEPPKPVIDITKVAGIPRRLSTYEWEIDFTLTIRNNGTVPAPFLRVADNLECTFRTYANPAPVTSWRLVGAPAMANGVLRVNPGYTGQAPCTAAQQTGGDAQAAMPTEPGAIINDGQVSFAPGAVEVIQQVVRFTLNPALGPREHVFNNTAYAASYDKPGDGAAIVAAAASSAAVLALDPSGVVYDAMTRQPVAGAVVRLQRTSCDGGAAGPITADQILAMPGVQYGYNGDGSVSMTTSADGAYYYYLKSPPVTQTCEYALHVTVPPASGYTWESVQIPPSPMLSPGGPSQAQMTAPAEGMPTVYYLRMRLGPSLPEVWNNHIPIDPAIPQAVLMLEKKSTKGVVEIGSSVPYEVTLRNKSGQPVTGFSITDQLPPGFRYLQGTSRIEGQPIPDPAMSGRTLRYDLPTLTLNPDSALTLAYVAQVGVTTPLGDAVNRAQATGGGASSNVATRKVRVEGGVFSNEAYLIGKVYLDLDTNGVQDENEPGIPGVRLVMEDGTSVVTDVEGKYSLYGLRAITHVLKVDTTTLPAGAVLAVLDSRNSGRGDSRFVDLKKGELHKADFAVANGAVAEVKEEVERRRQALADRPDAEGIAVTRARLDLQPQPLAIDQVRSRDASGEITPTGPKRPNAGGPTDAGVFQSVMPRDLAASRPLGSPDVAPRPRLEDSLLDISDATTGFIDLIDGDTLPMAVINVRVKGHADSTLQLSVNGKPQGLNRVGKRSKVAERQIEAWEYIGVELEAGDNTLLLEEIDQFGRPQKSVSLRVVAPGAAGKIELIAPTTAVADGHTRVPLRIRLTDDKGVMVTARTQLTLQIENGRWDIKDLNPEEPGTQVFLEGGEVEVGILPPSEPVEAIIMVSAGSIRKEIKLFYMPELRPLLGAGIVEGVLDFRRKGLLPVGQTSRDAFEETLRNFSRDSGGGKRSASARAAFYLKGTIQGEYLLTAAYDSDKDTRERLFRDIQPDKFYPIYGDSSTKLFDAQSTGRLYLRVDKGKSWLLFGDFVSGTESDVRKLSQYNRAATGAKYHYENDKVSVNAFARRDSLMQVVKEIPANGTSGPYLLDVSGLAENSERVEILVRDRNQPSIILATVPLTRFTDYTIEPLTGTLRFASPVASLDERLNSRSIRVTYEADSGGPSFWVGGIDGQLKLTDNLQVGASYARDENPTNPTTVAGATAILKLGPRSVVTAEVAQTTTGTSGTGNAARVEVIHEEDRLRLRAQATISDSNFDNQSAGFGKGRTEATIDASYQLDKSRTLKVEGIYSKDDIAGSERAGLLTTFMTPVGDGGRAEVGMRLSRDTVREVLPGSTAPVTLSGEPINMVTLRGRLSTRVPQLADANVYIEGEQDLLEKERRMLALGGDYKLSPQAKVYARYELISSLGNPYALSTALQNNVGVIGLETSYMKDGRTFNEFRIRDTINGRELQAASGVRRTWAISENLRLGGSFENTKAFGGIPGSNSTAVTGTAEYTEKDKLRVYGSLEGRKADTGDSGLVSLGVALKIDRDWSMLGRLATSIQRNDSDGSEWVMSREQVGFAWRQTETDRWNALGKYEHILNDMRGGANPHRENTRVISLSVNYQPARATVISGRYAFKWGQESSPGFDANFRGHLLSGRITQDITQDIDISAQAAGMWGPGGDRRRALGLEVGVHTIENLWVSLGYNWVGFPRDLMSNGEYLDQGVYVRVRYKFDEGVLK